MVRVHQIEKERQPSALRSMELAYRLTSAYAALNRMYKEVGRGHIHFSDEQLMTYVEVLDACIAFPWVVDEKTILEAAEHALEDRELREEFQLRLLLIAGKTSGHATDAGEAYYQRAIPLLDVVRRHGQGEQFLNSLRCLVAHYRERGDTAEVERFSAIHAEMMARMCA